jgi:hypothetical protein
MAEEACAERSTVEWLRVINPGNSSGAELSGDGRTDRLLLRGSGSCWSSAASGGGRSSWLSPIWR